jgi:hypothetical protein
MTGGAVERAGRRGRLFDGVVGALVGCSRFVGSDCWFDGWNSSWPRVQVAWRSRWKRSNALTRSVAHGPAEGEPSSGLSSGAGDQTGQQGGNGGNGGSCGCTGNSGSSSASGGSGETAGVGGNGGSGVDAAGNISVSLPAAVSTAVLRFVPVPANPGHAGQPGGGGAGSAGGTAARAASTTTVARPVATAGPAIPGQPVLRGRSPENRRN